MKLLLKFSGEHEKLPKAELEGVLKGEKIKHRIIEEIKESRILIINVKTKSKGFLQRLALTKKASEFIAKEKEISRLAEKIYQKIYKKGTFAIISSQRVEKKLGEKLVKKGNLKVNLENPKVRVVCFYSQKKYYAGIDIPLKRNFEERKPQFRPYFSPTSLHPKIARTLVNLSEVKKGDVVFDPFCGTGGILIEAGLMKMKIQGVDCDEKAVKGCRKNLKFYGLNGEIKRENALNLKLKKKVDAIVTDLPYGKSSIITEKNVTELYKKFLTVTIPKILKEKKLAVIMLPAKYKIKIPKKLFSVEGTYKIYVHKSLSRKILVLRKKQI